MLKLIRPNSFLNGQKRQSTGPFETFHIHRIKNESYLPSTKNCCPLSVVAVLDVFQTVIFVNS